MREVFLKLVTALALAGLWAGVPNSLQASYEWQVVEPHNSASDIGSQIRMETAWSFDNNLQVNVMGFRFQNIGSIASSLTEIAFDTGGLEGFSVLGGVPSSTDTWIINSPGVSYTAIKDRMIEKSPWGFQNESFVITTGAQPESKGGFSQNGVDADIYGTESVTLLFALKDVQQYTYIMESLGASFRVGVHVQALPDGQSDAYLTAYRDDSPPPPVVPEPKNFLVGLLLLLPFGAPAIRFLHRT